MIKITDPSSYGFDTPVATLVDVHGRGLDRDWLIKRAAAGVFHTLNLKPKAGHELIHLIAMGDAEAYGGNRNGDWMFGSGRRLQLVEPDWTKVACRNGTTHHRGEDTFTDTISCGNKDRYDTFEKFAHVFKNHKNKPHLGHKIYGEVKAAAHNDALRRVELMIEVPHGRDWDDDLEKLARDQDIPFSMACKVPYDVCLYCGHKAKTLDEYCPHVAQHMGELTKAGHLHGVANDFMTYFDISRVHRPADRIAWSLYGSMTKAAADAPGRVKLAAELGLEAEFGGYPAISVLSANHPARVHRRVELLRKAAELEKKLPLLAQASPGVKGIKGRVEKAACALPSGSTRLPELFRALADRAACLPLNKWAALVLGVDRYAAMTDLVERAAARTPGAFGDAMAHYAVEAAADPAYDPGEHTPQGDFRKMAQSWAADYGLTPEAVGARAIENGVYGTPAPMIKTASAVADPVAEGLVRGYVAYKLAFLDHVGRSHPDLLDFVLEAAVLQNLF
jgi:hypothetical protein